MLEHVNCEQRQEHPRKDTYDPSNYEKAHCNHLGIPERPGTTTLAVVSPRAYRTAEELGSDRLDYRPAISLSAGFAICPRDGNTAETLMDVADRALYGMKVQHKRAIRHC